MEHCHLMKRLNTKPEDHASSLLYSLHAVSLHQLFRLACFSLSPSFLHLCFFFFLLTHKHKAAFRFFYLCFFFLSLASVEVIVLSLFVLSSRIASSFLSCLDVHANALTSACIPHALHLSYTEFLKKKKGKIREAARLQDRYTRPDENVRVCACMRVPPFFFFYLGSTSLRKKKYL